MKKPYKSKILLSVETTALLVVDCESGLNPEYKGSEEESSLENIGAVVKSATALAIPVISTLYSVNGASVVDPLPSIAHLDNIIRTRVNPWEDDIVREKISDTGRDKVVIMGNCATGGVSFSALGALETGYQPYVVVDAIHSTSLLDASAALARMIQAGAISLTSRQVMLEWERS